MILVETPVRSIDDELLAITNGEADCEEIMFAYAQGARQALEWIKRGGRKPSDVISGGLSTLTEQ